jgi:hypothetical protein
MTGRRADDQPHGTKEQLLGNGTLTVAARLMSAVGVPIATGLLVFMGSEVWGELKANRVERQAIVVTLGKMEQRFAEVDRRNDQQDRYIDALRDRAVAAPARN